MSQEATASAPAPSNTVTTATEVPAPGATTATVPGTDLPAHSDAPGKIDLNKFFEDRYASKHKVKPVAKVTPAPTVAPPAAPTAPAASQAVETAKPVVAPPGAAEAPAVEPPKASPEQNEIDERLKRLAAASDSAARERKMREREQAADRKAREAVTAHADDIALAQKLREARTKGSKLALLEAAGVTRGDIEQKGWIVDLLNEVGEGEAPRALTEEDVERKIAARLKADEDARKAAADKAAEEANRNLAEAKAGFFSQVKVEFKAGEYPALRADKTTQGALDAFYQSHLARNPGQFWTAKELLDKAESATIAFYDQQEKKIADVRGKLRPKEVAPAPRASAATRTVTQSAAPDAVHVESPVKLGVREKQAKARDEFAARFAARSAK